MKKILVVLSILLITFSLMGKDKTLVRRGKMGNFFPSLSTSWKSLNEKTIEMTMAPGVNSDHVVHNLQKWFKRSVIEKKGDKKVLITTKYSLEQVLNRLTVIKITAPKDGDLKVADNDPMNMLKEPGSKTEQVSLIDDQKKKSENYFMGKVIKAEETFPSVKLKIRVTDASKNTGFKTGDIIEAEPYLKIEDGNPDTSDEDTADNLGALFIQNNDRIDALIKGKDKKGNYKLLKVQSK